MTFRPHRSAPLPPPSGLGGFASADTMPAPITFAVPTTQTRDPTLTSNNANSGSATPRGNPVTAMSSSEEAAQQLAMALDASFDIAMNMSNGGVPLNSGNPNAVQMGIMKGRLQGLQHEVQTAKRDIRELSERLTQTTTKLNEQKVQNSALTHKYSAVVAKLSESEQGEKQLEETLLEERRAHGASRDALDRAIAVADEHEATIRQLKLQLASKPQVDPQQIAALKDRAQFIPTKEVVEKQTLILREKDGLVETMTTALDRLLMQQEEDETSLFVCRSAVLSAATDLESKLAHTENAVQSLSAVFVQYIREQEEETSRVMTSLMNENKELWTHVTKMRFELDRSNSELAARNKKQLESVPKDQHEYVLKQVALLEEKLKRAQLTVEQQTRTEQEVESRMRDLLQQLQGAHVRAENFESQLAACQQTLHERESELSAATLSLNQRMQEVRELETLQLHQSSQVRSLTEQLSIVQETFETEGRQQLKSLQAERDEAVDGLAKLRSDFEDALHRMSTVEKELDQRTAYFNTYKTSIEEQHANYVRTLQEELSQSRFLFEREVDDLRRELADRTSEYHIVSRELDEERSERHGLKAALRTGDEEISRSRDELAQLQAAFSKSEDRVKRLAQELEEVKAENAVLDAKQQQHVQETSRLQSTVVQLEELIAEERQRHAAHASAIETDWKESDRSRQSLQDELKRLRQRVAESDQIRALKDRMERDKEQLMSENVRLHQQYQDVQQQNVTLQQTVTQLKSRVGASAPLAQQMEELQRKLQELPSLRYAADEARREALRAKEELESLRQERDEMSARLEFFLEESRSAAKKDNDLDRLFREATSQVRRLDQQLEEVNQRSVTKRHVSFNHGTSTTTPAGSTSPVGGRRSPVRPWRN